MKQTSQTDFIPQAEEGITEVKWIKKNNINSLMKNSYASINDVMRYGKV